MNDFEHENPLANIEAEKEVLGNILMEPELIEDCFLQPEEMSDPRHKNFLWTMKNLREKGVPLEITAIAERVGASIHKIGGLTYIVELAAHSPSTASFRFYQSVVREYAHKRKQYEIAQHLLRETLESETPGQARQHAIDLLTSIDDSNNISKGNGHVREGLIELHLWTEQDHGDITGAQSGFADLDRMTNGFQKEDLVIIAARPSVGKTALVLNVATNYATKHKGPVGLFSLEMSQINLLKRMISSVGVIDAQRMRNPTKEFDSADWNKYAQAMAEISDSPIHIYDDFGVNVQYIRQKARELKKLYPGEHVLIIIDYLQLISGDPKYAGNRTQEVSDISRKLKLVAKELGVTIIALSQLSRSVEQRQDKRPMMSDLRESGGIEQDADIIAFLYRDDYYDKESEAKGLIEIIIAKQRNGPTGTVTLAFKKEFNKFINIDWSQWNGK